MRAVNPPDRLVMLLFWQEGSNQVEDRTWYHLEYTWDRHMIASDLDTGG